MLKDPNAEQLSSGEKLQLISGMTLLALHHAGTGLSTDRALLESVGLDRRAGQVMVQTMQRNLCVLEPRMPRQRILNSPGCLR
jgi:hypothetical protein